MINKLQKNFEKQQKITIFLKLNIKMQHLRKIIL